MDVQFIDLNRARLFEGSLPNRGRALDLSRIHLPSDLLRIFKEMYFAGPPPADFERAEKRYRIAVSIRGSTRKWRHPIRSRQRETRR